MKARDYRDYLRDILDAVNDVESFVQGLTYNDLSMIGKLLMQLYVA